MSKLKGHYEITMRALVELKAEFRRNPVVGNISTQRPVAPFQESEVDLVKGSLIHLVNSTPTPAWGAVVRDMIDVFTLGHWGDSSQKHHFMRRFDGQSPYNAYLDGVEWIRKNATEAADEISRRLRDRLSEAELGAILSTSGSAMVAPGLPGAGGGAGASATTRSAGASVAHRPARVGATRLHGLFAGAPSDKLGFAAHALQDSFSPSHATRTPDRGQPKGPGRISHVKIYEGAEAEGHSHEDHAWQNGDSFSDIGRCAVAATKALALMVIVTALQKRAPVGSLLGWERFRSTWLVAHPSLSRERDFAYDLIDQHTSWWKAGSFNLATFNMDEEAIAATLFRHATDTERVRKVFERLDDKYNSDADDVAELFVRKVQRAGGAPLAALKRAPLLIDLLIRVMDEGWTTSGEEECIEFLRGLKAR
ncbi:MAG: hypothetical protein R3E97_04630 [Candidatus Eisenbacteria bacterium]